jgi:hypothetical protein
MGESSHDCGLLGCHPDPRPPRRPAEVLQALEFQQEPPPFEVVVVDDGSRTAPATGSKPVVRCRCGASSRRTTGRRRPATPAWPRPPAAGWPFWGTTPSPMPDGCAAHREAHRRRGDDPRLAVLGYTRWHPRMRLTPFLRYINEHGLQFGYSLIATRRTCRSTSSIHPTSRSPGTCCSPSPSTCAFPYPAWEDIELSYRLMRRRGLRLVYEPRPGGPRPSHRPRPASPRARRRPATAPWSSTGSIRSSGAFLGFGPGGPAPLPPAGRERRREFLVRALQHLPVRTPRLWDETLRYHYIRGLHRGVADGAGTTLGGTTK